MRLDILSAIADHLEKNVPDEDFDMDVWKCGTVGCAIGHSVELPIVQDAGLKIIEPGYGFGPTPYYQKDCPIGSEHIDYRAIAEAFSLSEKDTKYLFSPAKYFFGKYRPRITKESVVTRIRQFVKDNTSS